MQINRNETAGFSSGFFVRCSNNILLIWANYTRPLCYGNILEVGVSTYKHEARDRRPFWINIWLQRINTRGQAIFFAWFSLAASVALLGYGFWDYRAWCFSLLFLNGGFWISLAISWVDKNDQWN